MEKLEVNSQRQTVSRDPEHVTCIQMLGRTIILGFLSCVVSTAEKKGKKHIIILERKNTLSNLISFARGWTEHLNRRDGHEHMAGEK